MCLFHLHWDAKCVRAPSVSRGLTAVEVSHWLRRLTAHVTRIGGTSSETRCVMSERIRAGVQQRKVREAQAGEVPEIGIWGRNIAIARGVGVGDSKAIRLQFAPFPSSGV